MYLKKYDLSEKRVSDEKLQSWFEKAGFGCNGTIRRLAVGKYDVITITNHIAIMKINSRSNLITCRDLRTGEYIFPEYEAEIMHLLMETQWRDSKVELPEDENEKVIIKYSDDDNIFIITGFLWKTNKKYLAVGSAEDELFNTEHDKIDTICWLPIENVVL